MAKSIISSVAWQRHINGVWRDISEKRGLRHGGVATKGMAKYLNIGVCGMAAISGSVIISATTAAALESSVNGISMKAQLMARKVASKPWRMRSK